MTLEPWLVHGSLHAGFRNLSCTKQTNVYAWPLLNVAQLPDAAPPRSWAQLYEERPDEERATYNKGERLQVRHCTAAVYFTVQ